MKIYKSVIILAFCLLVAVAIYLLYFAYDPNYDGNRVRINTSSKHILITGVSGLIGSHLAEEVLKRGGNSVRVTGIDNYSTSLKRNADLLKKRYGHRFEMLEADVTELMEPGMKLSRLDEIYHLASPASPKSFIRDPIGS